MDPDLRRFKIITEIANTLDDDIQLTFKVPSKQENDRLPVLDLGLKVVNNKVPHYFYNKKQFQALTPSFMNLQYLPEPRGILSSRKV